MTIKVCFRDEMDNVLQTHVRNAPKNVCYTSKTIQNQMIYIIGNQICKDILEEVKEAKYFSVIADKVCDISNKEQLSISL